MTFGPQHVTAIVRSPRAGEVRRDGARPIENPLCNARVQTFLSDRRSDPFYLVCRRENRDERP